MRYALWIVGLFWLGVPAVAEESPPAADLPELVARGDIHRRHAPQAGETWLALYQANGRFGSCFGPWGLHPGPEPNRPYTLQGCAGFSHLQHWVRGKFQTDYLLPVGSLFWEETPNAVLEYRQDQSFWDGTLQTYFRTNQGTVEVTSWFDPVHRDVAGFRIDVQGPCSAVVFAPFAPAGGFPYKYGQHLEQTFTGQVEAGVWKGTLRCLDRQTPLQLRSSAPLEVVPEGVRIALQPGRNDILVVVGNDAAESADASRQATQNTWHALWQRSGWLDLPDDDAQKVWVRSLAYINSTFNDDGLGCPAPNGLTGLGWPFPFPFDSGCAQPLLLWTGSEKAARAWLECWRGQLEGLQAYTKRFWHQDGLMLPHVFPYGSAADFQQDGPPNRFYYPVYNAGHLVRIAHQTAVLVNDPEWTRRVALPLIDGVARFYRNIAQKGADGLWHFSVTPSIGLDEAGGNDQPDYFCTLVSAEYSFRRAIDYGLDTDGQMQTILRDGLAYPTLLSPEGVYYGNAGSGKREFGQQKHPDQLAAVVHIPLGHPPDAPTIRSYQRRYELTSKDRPLFQGHTGGEFILASARMHDPEGWRQDWSRALASRYTDPDWIQLYETSGRDLPFYITTQGLFAQSILETVVSTWWDRLDLAACIPWPGTVRFGNIRTALGVTVSGEVRDGQGEAVVKAWKDTTVPYRSGTLVLKAGEEARVPIGPPEPHW